MKTAWRATLISAVLACLLAQSAFAQDDARSKRRRSSGEAGSAASELRSRPERAATPRSESYAGPQRWGLNEGFATRLRMTLFPDPSVPVELSADLLSPYVLLEQTEGGYQGALRGKIHRIQPLVECHYQRPDTPSKKLQVVFWPAGARQALPQEVVAAWSAGGKPYADAEVQGCPANLAQAIDTGYGPVGWSVLERKIAQTAFTPICREEFLAAEESVQRERKDPALWHALQDANRSGIDRLHVLREVATAHLRPQARWGRQIVLDDSSMSTCLLRYAANATNDPAITPYALEGYALRLWSDRARPHGEEEALSHLARASSVWHYGCAAMRLANIHLDRRSNPHNRAEAKAWLMQAIKDAPRTPEGSTVSADEAMPRLFELLTSDRLGGKNLQEAEDLYRSLSTDPYYKEKISAFLPHIPGLEQRLADEKKAHDEWMRVHGPEIQRKTEAWWRCQKNYPENASLKCGATVEQYRGLW